VARTRVNFGIYFLSATGRGHAHVEPNDLPSSDP
jgi:hypothetical protein